MSTLRMTMDISRRRRELTIAFIETVLDSDIHQTWVEGNLVPLPPDGEIEIRAVLHDFRDALKARHAELAAGGQA